MSKQMQRVLIYYLSPILTLPCLNNMHCCGIRLWRSNFSFGLWILFYIFLILFYFKLYIIVLVLPNIKMNPPQVYMCSPSWTLLPSPSPYHTSGLSQCTSPKHPVSCIEPGLVTRFIHDILQVSMPFSQIFPPSRLLLPSTPYLNGVQKNVSIYIHGSLVFNWQLYNNVV